MSSLVRSRRLLSHTCKRSGDVRRLCSPAASDASAKQQSSLPSAASMADQATASSAEAASSGSANVASKSRAWSFLKFGVAATLTGAVGAASYATYAYSLDEVNAKTRDFRSSSSWTVGDDAPSTDKLQALVYSLIMKVPVKAIEIYMDVRKSIEEQIQGFVEPSSEKLLPDLHPQEQHVFTLVLDLNETLVYSDWTRERGWRTFKRPGVDAFLEHMAKFYEVVIYSDQMSMYVDPIVERLDQKGYIRYRLSRNATKYKDGKHYRDLSKLNRDPAHILYVSAHALENSLQRENCVFIKPYKCENNDTELVDLIPFLEYVARHRPTDIRPVLTSYEGHDIPSEFIKRSKEYQKRMQEQKQQGLFWRR
ncbi:haloacid dehalogenase-like hydrolase (HAD) superfamily protein [Wolffia australiana]